MSNGEEDLSIETYEKALVENPKQPSCLKNIGLIYEKRGRYAEQNGDLDNRDIWFDRSEERRVGKECRSRWSPYH